MNHLMVAPAHDQDCLLCGLTLLVVDDDPDTRLLLSFLLQEGGATVFEADSVSQAMAVLAQHQPNILLSDVLLAGEDGYELIHQMKTLDAHPKNPILAIAVTGLVGDEDRDRMLKGGFHGFIRKPIDVDQFVIEIANLYKTLIASPQ
jgi:CheY-like chemotaxis protein